MKNLFLMMIALIPAFPARAQWEPDVRLTNAPGISYTSYNDRNVAASGGNVHVAWQDNRDGNSEIYYKRSTDEGTNWGPDTRLTFNTATSQYPSINASGLKAYVVWADQRDGNLGEIYFKRSLDGGDTWEDDMRLTFADYRATVPSIAISDSVLHVTWEDSRFTYWGQIFYKRSTDGGVTWSDDMRLTDDTVYSANPSIAASGSMVHIVWEDMRDGHGEAYYLRSTDGGLNWEPEVRLTTGTKDSWDPCVAVAGSVVHVAYMSNVGITGTSYDTFYKRSLDNGISWSESTRLSLDPSNSKYPSIAVNDPDIHVVWEDYRNGQREIYYQTSFDGGDTWLQNDVCLSNCPGIAYFAHITTSDSAVLVVWSDYRDNEDEIYYKRCIMGSLVGTGNEPAANSGERINIFPNPASDYFMVNIQDLPVNDATISIQDMSGDKMLSSQIVNDHTLFDISALMNGIYLVSIHSNGQLLGKTKLIVLKN
jgi:hypothetical protein